jgi:hypothetical protein
MRDMSAQNCGCDRGADHQCERHAKLPHPDRWIAVDFDGTLAEWDPDGGPQQVWAAGQPIAPMVARVRGWLAEGKDVRIFTARVGCNDRLSSQARDDQEFAAGQRALIEAWCLEHLGEKLPITATKDWQMIECWDDKVIKVITNTGETLEERYAEALARLTGQR